MKKQELSKLGIPETPGVYFFRDSDGHILYIGKATSLADRVRSYFATDLHDTRGLRIVSMVTTAHTITWQETPSVLEALLLESKLIKEHTPPYNVKEKDNKSFMCVVITKEDFPRVLMMRMRDYERRFTKKDTQAVYGPFSSGTQLRDAMKIIRKLFPYRDTCIPASSLEGGVTLKPCFNAQIGLCPGVCTGDISRAEYKKTITRIKQFFEGKRESIKRTLQKDMDIYANKHEFEKAAHIRNTLFALDHIRDTALIKDDKLMAFKDNTFRIEAYDVAHISGTHRVGVMVVLEGGEKEASQYRKFKLVEKVNDDYEGLRELLQRRFTHKEWRFPDLIVFDGGVGQKATGEKVLASLGLLIPCVSVVKDDRHKPKDILGDKVHVNNHKKEILLANGEAHRFAIGYHKLLRGKLLQVTKKKVVKS